MKLEIIRQFFGTNNSPNKKVAKLGPCIMCKYMHRNGKYRYCHKGPLKNMQYVLNYTNETGEYFGCEDFTLRNRKKRIRLL